MLTTLYYFLQVILCSGIMMGYYWLVLRDKKFHQYNRFYLLMTAVTAWIIPLVKIQWVPKPAAKVPVYEFLTVIADGNARIDASLHNRWYQLSWQSGLTLLYVIVSTVFLIILLTGIMRVWRLLRTHKITSVGDFFLILTKTEGTPFSFFSYVFWNEAVDVNSNTGKQMLQHEITHVQEKHSLDKLFIQLSIIAGWFNPFFWMLKAEMSMIHEYIADKKSVEQGDTAALASMLLAAAYPQQQFLLSNPFFFSPIKRRIAMLANQSHPKFSYLRRLVILPLLAVVVVLFAFRSKDSLAKKPISLKTVIENLVDEVKGKEASNSTVGFKLLPLSKKYIVVLNPGHGGTDPGAKAADGTTEAALVLQYAKLIKSLNQNDQIEFVLNREEEQYMSVSEITNFINSQNADLCISIHANSAEVQKFKNGKLLDQPSGLELYISNKQTAISSKSYIVANTIAANLKAASVNVKYIKTRPVGTYILNNSNCPTVLTELGYLTNKEDLKKLNDPAYRKNLATAILNGVQDYLYQKENTLTAVKDTTILTGDSVYVVPNGKEVKIIGNPTFVIPKVSDNYRFIDVNKGSITFSNKSYNPLVIVDGIQVDSIELKTLNPNDIDHVRVLKDKSAIEIFGEKGKNGVIEIKTKKGKSSEGYRFAQGSNFSAVKFDEADGYLKTVNRSSAILLDGNIISKEDALKLDVRDIMHIGFGDFPIDKVMKSNVLTLQTKKGIRNSSSQYSVEELRRLDEMDAELKSKNDSNASAKKFNKIFSSISIDNSEQDQPNMSEVMKAFYKRNPDIKQVSWAHAPLRMLVDLKNGSRETYDLTNASSKALAEKRYGDLPMPAPPPPPMPNKKLAEIPLKKAEDYPAFPKKIPLSIRAVPKDKSGQEEVYEKVFTKTEVPASFPGGQSAWLKYLERNLKRDIPVEKGAPPGTYKVIVSFIVKEDGTIQDVKGDNDPGFGTKEEAVRMIMRGPKWKPAQQNGKNVTSRVKQSITYVVAEE